MAISQTYPRGASEGASAQHGAVLPLLGNGGPTPAATANTTDATTPAQDVRGINGALTAEFANSGAGTCDVQFQGTHDPYSTANDQSNWTPIRMLLLGQAGVITPDIEEELGAVTFLTVALLDAFPTIRARVFEVVGAVSVSCRLYACPQ